MGGRVKDTRSPGNGDPTEQLTEIARVVKRVALVSFPRDKVASLTGATWLAFLDDSGTGEFSSGPAQLLASAPYRRGGELTSDQLVNISEQAVRWVTQHHEEESRA